MAAKRITPNPENCSLAELEVAAKATPTQKGQNRLLAIRALLLGHPFSDVAAIFCVVERTLQRWVTRFNARGIDGLIEQPRSGRPRRISLEQAAHYRHLIEKPESVGQVHWTAKKFHGYLRDVLQQEVGYSTLVRFFHENNYRLKVPQPWSDRQDEKLREEFVLRLQQYMSDESIELWFADEMGVEGDPRPRRRWAKKGAKPRVTKNGEHLRMSVTGMVCPRRGEFYALEFPYSDRDVFQAFLDNANADLKFERPRNLLIMDNASWHKCKSLDWGRFEAVYLPPYSPDLNPIERLWLLIKAEFFSDFIAKDRPALIERLDQALLWAMGRSGDNQKTCSIKTKL